MEALDSRAAVGHGREEMNEAIQDEAAVEFLLLCGWYHAISFVARALRLSPEPDTPAFADSRP